MQPYSYWAVVTDNADPEKLNRVRVSKIGEKPGVTEWLPIITPFTEAEAVLSFRPEIDELVMVVCFEGAEIEKGVLNTKIYNYISPQGTRENTEAGLNPNGENTQSIVKTKSGSQLIFDDTEAEGKIQYISADGQTRLEFGLDDKSVSLTTEHDLTLGTDIMGTIQAEELEIICDNITYTLLDAEIEIDAERNIEIKSYKEIKADGQDISFSQEYMLKKLNK